ncbi:MAG: NAD-dependent epimerase/dehydratase family protein [bacterium]|nr:NAD-dependent epimerase/dehydratase family protein [bacterium]
MDKKPRILITGSSGMIGTRLFETLLSKGYDAVGFDRKKNRWASALDRLTIHGDLLKKQDLKKIPSKIDLIIHLAANARVYNLVVKPDLALENMMTMYNVLEFARTKKIQNIIFSGSREVYSNKGRASSKEHEVDITMCESPYAASKISNEALLYAFSKCYGISYIVLRLSNVYGMYDDSDRFFPLMIKKMRAHKDVYVYGKEKLLDFTYIDDCVAALMQGIKKFSIAKNNTFNIASGKGDLLIKVAGLLKKRLRSRSRIAIRPARKGEVVQYVADIAKARKLLRYHPSVSLEDGLDRTIQWYAHKQQRA